MNGKTAFIYNPVAGSKSARKGIAIIQSFAEDNNCAFLATEYKGHATIIAESLIGEYQNIIVAGGDGTINEVATTLKNTRANLGIIPMGSGNGMAHHLGIPTDTIKALHLLNNKPRKIDLIAVNNSIIVNVGGIGFDSHVANLFNKSADRGLISYLKLIISELGTFKEFDYSLTINGKEKSGTAFIIAIANGSEFGNRFKVDAKAKIDDGELSIIVIKKPPWYKLPGLLTAGYQGKLKESIYYHRSATTTAHIQQQDCLLHCDGEVDERQSAEDLQIKILPASLNLIY